MNSPRSGGYSRREFIRFGIAGMTSAGVAQALARDGHFAAAATGRIPIGLQLYSVRREFGRDQAGTLAAVAKFGFEGVEFAGYFNRTASDLRKMLDDNGLKCCGTHLSIDQVTGDNLGKTIEFNQTLGNKLLIIPGLPPKRTATQEAWLEDAKQFTEIAGKLKPVGMRIGYHNHQTEFKPLEGKLPFDTFFSNTPKEVVMQVDVGTALEAGADLKSVFEKYPGRTASLHVKEYSKTNPKAYVGEGDANWKEIFDILEKQGATEWYIVEYEIEGMPALDSVNRCLQNLRKMGK